MKSPIQSVEVTYFIHATEEPEKVVAALTDLLGMQAAPEVERLEGHFGNEILSARVHLTGEDADRAFKSLVSRLPPSLREKVVGDLQSHLDEHSALFLRFDKQRLVSGSMDLGSADPVRVKVKPRGFVMKGKAADFYAGLIGGR